MATGSAAASITLNVDNATPTPTTRDFLPLVKAMLGQAPGVGNGQDQMLALLADRAMQKYGELRPKIERVTITSQQGTLAYPLPADCANVYDVAIPSQYGYYNDWLFLPMIDTPASTLFGYSDYAFRSPTERVIRQGILSELDHYALSYAGYYCDGSPLQLYLLPTSTASGLPIQVRYGATYQNESADPLNPAWTHLPVGHYRHVLDLIKWALMDSRADQIASSLSISQQGGGNAAMTESWKVSNRADRILQAVRSSLGVDVGVAIRS